MLEKHILRFQPRPPEWEGPGERPGICTRWFSAYDGSISQFLDSTMVWNEQAIGRSCPSDFEFGPFPKLVARGTIFSCEAGHRGSSRSARRSQGSTIDTLTTFCIPTAFLFVTFSTVANTLHERVSTFLPNRLCVNQRPTEVFFPSTVMMPGRFGLLNVLPA